MSRPGSPASIDAHAARVDRARRLIAELDAEPIAGRTDFEIGQLLGQAREIIRSLVLAEPHHPITAHTD